MRINANTRIVGQSVVLVPYRPEHVALYHEWMQSPFLQETTASEPLTLEQEYEMQRSWAEDDDKCTFILLDPQFPDTPGTGAHGGAMAGDVNVFLNDPDDRTLGELEVMIAEERSRRKGIAREALQLFMAYCYSRLGLRTFRVKIGEDNSASIALFTSIGFRRTGYSAVFKEVQLDLSMVGEGETDGGRAEDSGGQGPGAEGEPGPQASEVAARLERAAALLQITAYDEAGVEDRAGPG